ncbi:uncharacterized protein CCR75_004826 [Bremia lactucae]|uniref:Uncharacterized protein n=1 Tax=Bremia lactucae TaxID=4779 RepID=A0A976IDE9_BRELC|nr:hypothetical protein CCR75_004826 [Bremia lactucae]
MSSISTAPSGGETLALSDILGDLDVKMRGLMLMAIDQAMKQAMKTQRELLDTMKAQVEVRHRVAINKLRDDMTRAQPVLVEQVVRKTLSVETNAGLVNWITDETLQRQAVERIQRLRRHLDSGLGNAFRSDFESLLAVYMEFLNVPTSRGMRLNQRIEDLHEALYEKADYQNELVNLVYRVRWGCQGVRSIGNARSHDATLLSESESLELCGCISAIGAAMPTLARQFDVCQLTDSSSSSPLSSDSTSDSINNTIKVDQPMHQQVPQAVSEADTQSPFDFVMQLMATNGMNLNTPTSTLFQDDADLTRSPVRQLPPRVQKNSFASLTSQDFTNLGSLSAQIGSLSSRSSGLSGLDLNSMNGLHGNQAPSLARLGSIGSTASTSSRETPPLPFGYNDTYNSVWSQPPLPPSSLSPQKPVMHFPLASYNSDSPLQQPSSVLSSKSPMKQPPLPSRAITNPHVIQPPTAFPVKQPEAVPTQAILAMVPKFSMYYSRPTELPKETDRVRKAMFARMLNHMHELPKATMCPLQPGHDPACPLSHSYLEVMTFNPLYKRLICRQPSHYWGSQLQEDDNCVCLHIDTGLSWDWMEEHKRLYCARGSKCVNFKCLKSHSFEEMCWYNPSYKIKRCSVRSHDHIARARGTLAPPLDCSYYHIEEGKNCDKRDFAAEDDHVGLDVPMLFIERSHKPLADRLEAVRYARTTNL